MIELVLFYTVLFATVGVILCLLEIQKLHKKISEGRLWILYWNNKMIFNSGQQSMLKKLSNL